MVAFCLLSQSSQNLGNFVLSKFLASQPLRKKSFADVYLLAKFRKEGGSFPKSLYHYLWYLGTLIDSWIKSSKEGGEKKDDSEPINAKSLFWTNKTLAIVFFLAGMSSSRNLSCPSSRVDPTIFETTRLEKTSIPSLRSKKV